MEYERSRGAKILPHFKIALQPGHIQANPAAKTTPPPIVWCSCQCRLLPYSSDTMNGGEGSSVNTLLFVTRAEASTSGTRYLHLIAHDSHANLMGVSIASNGVQNVGVLFSAAIYSVVFSGLPSRDCHSSLASLNPVPLARLVPGRE
ncbi:hypothetical protein VNO77_15207 [Canavalia gladiata]|uniref:Uncharacterized protein n=1 Tax=Canavalia gladiata TaxID=3824 RepID=A0AAN9LZF2_CANGL